jgi:hypothetical protein
MLALLMLRVDPGTGNRPVFGRHLPQRLPSVKAEGAERIGIGQFLHCSIGPTLVTVTPKRISGNEE